VPALQQVLLVVHMLIAAALIGVVLLQRSEGGGLGMGGGGGMMTVRGTANLLTRATAVLAACFMASSIILAILSGTHSQPSAIVDDAPPPAEAPAEPAQPGVPLSE
jgi:preprotein translocase subunit SecG